MKRTSPWFTHEQAPDGMCPTHGKPLLDIGHSTGKLYCPNQGHDGMREAVKQRADEVEAVTGERPTQMIIHPDGVADLEAEMKLEADPEWLA